MLRRTHALAVVVLLGLSAVILSGCSAKAKLDRHLAKGESYFSSGQYEAAEIEFLNVLQAERTNATAIARLGVIYAEQGRVSQAIGFLRAARELSPDNLEVRQKLAELYIALGARTEAAEEARFILQKQPSHPTASILLAQTATDEATVQGVRSELQAAGIPSDQAPALTALGMLSLREGKIDEAETAFSRAVALDTNAAMALSGMAGVRLARGDPTGAAEFAARAAAAAPLRSPIRMQQIRLKLMTGDRAGAKQTLEEIVARTPDWIPALVQLAEIHAQDQNLKEASRLTKLALAKDNTLPDVRSLAAGIELAEGRIDEAVAILEGVLSDFPRWPKAHFQMALTRLAQNNPSAAQSHLAQVVALEPDNIEAAMLLASLHTRTGDYSSAILVLRDVITKRPALLQARYLLSNAYRAQQRFDEALNVLREAEQAIPGQPQTQLLVGMIQLEQNRPVEARQSFREALIRAPDHLGALEQLVNLDLREKKQGEARSRVDAEITRKPDVATLHVLRARVASAQGDTSAAEADLKRAIELEPNSPGAYLLLAQIYLSAGQQARALENLDTVLTKNPADQAALTLKAMLLGEAGDHAAARTAYEALLAANPQHIIALNNLAYIYAERLNEADKAVGLAERARQLQPYDPNIADTLGWALFRKGDYARAATLLQESLDKLPDHPEVNYHAGMAYYMLGREAPAKAAFTRALQSGNAFPGDVDCRQRLELLNLDIATANAPVRTALEERLKLVPDDPIALNRLAEILERDGDTARAIDLQKRSLAASPDNPVALLALARLHAAQGDTTKAIEFAQNARKAAPTDARIAHTLGRLAYQTNQYSWAYSLLQEASRGLAGDPRVQLDFGLAAYATGRIPEAHAAISRASAGALAPAEAEQASQFLALVAPDLEARPSPAMVTQAEARLTRIPDDVPALMVKAAALESARDYPAAIATLEKALTRYPDFTPAMRRIALVAADYPAASEKALPLALKARDTYRNDDALARALGIIQANRGDSRRAVELLRGAATRFASDPIVFYYLGLAQIEQKSTADGRANLQKALDLGLTGEFAERARTKLAE